MTVEAWALEKAVARYWWRHPKDEGTPLPFADALRAECRCGGSDQDSTGV